MDACTPESLKDFSESLAMMFFMAAFLGALFLFGLQQAWALFWYLREQRSELNHGDLR